MVALTNAILTENTASENNTSAITGAINKTQDKQDESKQMSQIELLTILQMCGKTITGELADLPAWLQELSFKGTTDPYKLMMVKRYIMANTFFEHADLPMTSQLPKMIMKRSWTGKDGNINQLFIVNVMDGLLPFPMLDLNEDEVALLNNEQY